MPKRRLLTVVAVLVLIVIAQPARVSLQAHEPPVSDTIAIVGATLIDGTAVPPRTADVLIRGNRIAAVGAKLDVPKGARVVMAQGQTLLPGIFDIHTHLPYSTQSLSPDWPKNLKAYLYCGVTSVVDFGSYAEMFEPMRRLIASGVVPAPRISLAARISTPGGHGAEGGRGDFFTLEVQTPRQARAAIRRLLPYKPDVIKAFTDGWRYNTIPDLTSMNEATLSALVDEAHQHGLKVLTHTVTVERDKIAARAGVDVIDHGAGNADVDDELIALLKQHGTTYASTLAVYEDHRNALASPLAQQVVEPAVKQAMAPQRSEVAREGPAPESGAVGNRAAPRGNRANPDSAIDPAAQRAARWQHLTHNVATLQAAGVRLGNGTDAGETATFHGYAALHEIELAVAAGVPPLAALQNATLNSARALGVDKERGSIEPGKLADLLLVRGAPQQNIADIENITRVFFDGREVDRERLAADIAAAGLTPLPAVKIAELADDFEGAAAHANGAGGNDEDALRSDLGTRWVTAMDAGADHSDAIYERVLRAAGNHALLVTANMSLAERPFVAATLPLARGGIEPADLRSFRGISFDVRGDGDYTFVAPTRAVRTSNFFQAPFSATPHWQNVGIDFATLKQPDQRTPAPWIGDDALALIFRIPGKPQEQRWLELDNIRFYK
jgi:imidazolonepropionase-like amidohydrolase